MNLDELLSPFTPQALPSLKLGDICNDSRDVTAGSLFLAYPGLSADGRHYIEQAFDQGAAAVVYEADNLPDTVGLPADKLCIALENLSGKLPQIAQRFYQHPQKKLALTGVTGTNGKTTIAWLLAQAHQLLGVPSAYIGTLGEGSIGRIQALQNTTPDALCLQKLFYQYQQAGIRQVAMEVSSHALDQGRVSGLAFQQAIFTNLTHDHLDYHHSFERYAQAKAKLFAVDSLEYAIINQDDPAAEGMLKHAPATCKVYRYGFHQKADVHALDMHVDQNGILANIKSPWGNFSIQMALIGQFNLYNAMAVFTSLVLSGYRPEHVIRVLRQLQASPGRMEIVAHQPLAIVDFAHSPDALQNVLSTLKQFKKGRLLLVFGCGGERDKAKRPLMGAVAARFADQMIITSDNPRHEEPEHIMDEIAAGIPPEGKVLRICDRRKAIITALDMANSTDTVLIAGKGHEAYQWIGDQKTVFSDQDVVRQWLADRP
ncbi:MAG: UDP-N-acetylmuramoyl-L-alanyl-D-glutamate--2,6-diaminopimelate ligase [Legionellaceae bacterium]|nr:UDP-N-acetylmuramoyl-L-alanyl-D-glutamate--2,6-diaminopimelate ligase [Legionellaceae bacterium]